MDHRSGSGDHGAGGPIPPTRPDSEWVARQVEAMAAAWGRGERPEIGATLARHPGIDDESAIRLIYEDVCLRRESGQEVATAEVVARFPRWRDELEVLLRCDRLMRPAVPVRFPEAGQRLGDYRILAELGRGTSGRTFLAAQPSLADRPVVLKVMPREHEEHLSLARLQHTHIVPLYAEQAFPDRGLRALCMPYLGGADLARIFEALAAVPAHRRVGRDLLRAPDRSRTLPVDNDPSPVAGPFRHELARASYVASICWIAACLADALQYAHDRGLIHMDVKPSNVLISGDGQPMLLDFHLARGPVSPGEPRPERLGGTPCWMSPEQGEALRAAREGRPAAVAVDGRSDIYSLGLLLREALGGPRASDGGEGAGSGVDGSRLDACNPEVSVGLADIVAKCLARDPDDRYQAASALADDLRRHLSDLPLVGVENRSVLERWRKWKRRRPQALARWSARLTAAVAAAAVLALSGTFYYQRARAIEADLADARRFRADRQFPEAIRSARRGLALARGTPGVTSLTRALDDQLRLALRGRMARELHELADLIRFRYGVAPPMSGESRTLVDRCRKIWEARDLLATARGGPIDPELERSLRADLLELAVVWTDLRVRLSTPEARDEVRRDALRVLDEADASFGPSPSLARERRALARALGMAGADRAPVPAPRTAWEHYDLGRSYLRSGQTAEAAEEFCRTLDLRPQDFWPNFYQGLCAYRLGQHEDALAAFRACITLAPATAECYYNRALAYEALGRAGPAARDYTRALELDGRLTAAALNRGILSYKAGRTLDAIADLQRALNTPADRELLGQIQYNLALVHLARDDRPSALASLERAIAAGNREAHDLRDRLEARR